MDTADSEGMGLSCDSALQQSAASVKLPVLLLNTICVAVWS